MAQNSNEVALILGAGGQIGTELRTALQARYGVDGVISTDLKPCRNRPVGLRS